MSTSRSSPGNNADGGCMEAFLSPKRKLATRSTSSKKFSTAIQPISTHYLDDISSPTSSPRYSNERSTTSSYDKSEQNSNGFSLEMPFDMPFDGEHSSGRFTSRSTNRSQSIQSTIEYPTPSSSSSSALNKNQSLLQRVFESAGKGKGKGKDLLGVMPVTSSSPESSSDSSTAARRKCNFDGSPMDRDSNSTKRSMKHGRKIGVKCSSFGNDSDEETKSSTNSGMSKNSKLMSRCYPARSCSSRNSDDDRQCSNESDSSYFEGRFSTFPVERKLPLSRSLLSPAYEDNFHNGSRISSPSENTMNMEKLNCNASRNDEIFPPFDPLNNRDRLKRIPENSDLRGRTFLEISSSEPSCVRKFGLGKVVVGTPFSNFSSPSVTRRNNSSNIFMGEDRSDIDDSRNFPGNWANDTDLSEYNYSNSFVMSTPPAELRDLGTPVTVKGSPADIDMGEANVPSLGKSFLSQVKEGNASSSASTSSRKTSVRKHDARTDHTPIFERINFGRGSVLARPVSPPPVLSTPLKTFCPATPMKAQSYRGISDSDEHYPERSFSSVLTQHAQSSSMTQNKLLISLSDSISTTDVSFSRDFRSRATLGSGSTADVFMAREKDGKCYAVKKIKIEMKTESARNSLIQEGNIMRKLSESPCNFIIHLIRAWQEDGCFFLQIDLAEKGTIRDLLVSSAVSGSLLAESTIWHIVHDVASGLKHVHDHGFVHLDIKPANLLISREGIIKIGDFGQAVEEGTEKDGCEGDAGYMAPELFNSDIFAIRNFADIFSLGITLYECCMPSNYMSLLALGKYPVNEDDYQVLTSSEGRVPPSIPSNYSAALAEAIRAAMSPTPCNRPATSQLLAIEEVIRAGCTEDSTLQNKPVTYTDLEEDEYDNITEPTGRLNRAPSYNPSMFPPMPEYNGGSCSDGPGLVGMISGPMSIGVCGVDGSVKSWRSTLRRRSNDNKNEEDDEEETKTVGIHGSKVHQTFGSSADYEFQYSNYETAATSMESDAETDAFDNTTSPSLSLSSNPLFSDT